MIVSRNSQNSRIMRRGLMLVLSSPSGAGKTSICRRLIELEPDISMSVSVTTRPRRSAEQEGVDYQFVDTEHFNMLCSEGALLEHAEVFGHYYGTPRGPVEAALGNGCDVLFDVDWQGAQQLSDRAAKDVVMVSILPPSMDELENRLRTRNQDSPEVVARRMDQASDEMSRYDAYDYIVVNHDIERSVADIHSILIAERLRRCRQKGLKDFIRTLSGDD